MYVRYVVVYGEWYYRAPWRNEVRVLAGRPCKGVPVFQATQANRCKGWGLSRDPELSLFPELADGDCGLGGALGHTAYTLEGLSLVGRDLTL